MNKLLRIEWMKVKGYTAFHVFTILYFLAMIGINFIGFYLNEKVSEAIPMGAELLGTPYSFPKVWQTTAWMDSWLLYFPGILFIMLLTNEFNYKTHRQNIIDGLSRRSFITVKFVMGFIAAVLTTIAQFIIAFLFGSFSKFGKFSFTGVEFIGYGFIQSLVYIYFAIILAFLLRRSGVAIIVFFLFGLIFENLLVGLINNQLTSLSIGYFFPLQIADSLIDLPFGSGKKLMYQNAPQVWILISVSLLYASLYFYFAKMKFSKDDL